MLDLLDKGAVSASELPKHIKELKARFNHTRTLLNNLLDWTLLPGAAASNSDTVLRGSAWLLAYSAGLGLAFLLVAVFFVRGMTFFRWVRDHYDWIRYLSGGTLVVLGLLLFFNRDWWLRVLLNRALDAIGLGGQL